MKNSESLDNVVAAMASSIAYPLYDDMLAALGEATPKRKRGKPLASAHHSHTKKKFDFNKQKKRKKIAKASRKRNRK